VVCLSKQFNQAGFRQKEVRLALDTAMEKPEGEIFIIPARLEECETLESLRKWHWVDLFEIDGYRMLLRALRIRADKIGATLYTNKNWMPEATIQSAVVKKPSIPIEKPVELKQEKPKPKEINQAIRIFYKASIGIAGLIVLALAAIFGVPYLIGKSASTPTATQLIDCTSITADGNPYKISPQSWTRVIFQHAEVASTPDIATKEQLVREARYESYRYITSVTKRWSDTKVIQLEDFVEIQFTLIFVTPELLQSILLAEALDQQLAWDDFNGSTTSFLINLAQRNELLFFFLINATQIENTSVNALPHKIEIPSGLLSLENAENNSKVYMTHDSVMLDQPIYSSSPVFGIIAYPVIDHECQPILDSANITSSVPYVLIDGKRYESLSWQISYETVLNSPPLPHSFEVPSNFDTTRISPLSMPPVPLKNLLAREDSESMTFWEDMGRFVWGQLTMGHY
jgi:hypothetical protein